MWRQPRIAPVAKWTQAWHLIDYVASLSVESNEPRVCVWQHRQVRPHCRRPTLHVSNGIRASLHEREPAASVKSNEWIIPKTWHLSKWVDSLIASMNNKVAGNGLPFAHGNLITRVFKTNKLKYLKKKINSLRLFSLHFLQFSADNCCAFLKSKKILPKAKQPLLHSTFTRRCVNGPATIRSVRMSSDCARLTGPSSFSQPRINSTWTIGSRRSPSTLPYLQLSNWWVTTLTR